MIWCFLRCFLRLSRALLRSEWTWSRDDGCRPLLLVLALSAPDVRFALIHRSVRGRPEAGLMCAPVVLTTWLCVDAGCLDLVSVPFIHVCVWMPAGRSSHWMSTRFVRSASATTTAGGLAHPGTWSMWRWSTRPQAAGEGFLAVNSECVTQFLLLIFCFHLEF